MRKIIVALIIIGAGAWFFFLKDAPNQKFDSYQSLAVLHEQATNFHGKKISTKGQVTNRVMISGIGYYTISDGDYSIVVLSKSSAPDIGAKVSVTGIFNQTISVGKFQKIGIVETERKQ